MLAPHGKERNLSIYCREGSGSVSQWSIILLYKAILTLFDRVKNLIVMKSVLMICWHLMAKKGIYQYIVGSAVAQSVSGP